jgi:hypothetical protein
MVKMKLPKAPKVRLPKIPTPKKILKEADKAFDGVVEAVAKPIKDGARELSKVEQRVKDAIGDASERLGGEGARALVEDIVRVAKPLTYSHFEAMVESVEEFLKTGNLEALNPLATLVAGEMRMARDAYWDRARPIDGAVRALMPAELQVAIDKARFISMAEVQAELPIPTFAINHLKRASAMVAIDLIFFKNVPDAETEEGRHYWAHELWHVMQYSKWGVDEFVRRYLGNEFGFRGKGSQANAIEEEADRVACRFFRISNPRYIRACP